MSSTSMVNLLYFWTTPNGQYTKQDKQRMFVKVPLGSGNLYSQLVRIEEKMRNHILTLSTLDSFVIGNVYKYEWLVKHDEKHNKADIKVKLDIRALKINH